MSVTYQLSPAETAEWECRSNLDREGMENDPLGDCMADPIWRLCNLYQIMNADGTAIHFTPNPEQRVVIWVIHGLGWRRLLIPKARQLGMSTVLLLIGEDLQIHVEGFTGALVDKTQPDCAKKMREKYHFTWEHLPEHIRNEFTVSRSNDGELAIALKAMPGSHEEPPQSIFQAGISFRGGTVRWLHISEWGWIQDMDRPRSREIQSGALPAVEKATNGICVVETTWKGGLDGELGPYVEEARGTQEHDKGPKSWRILFFPWYNEPSYAQDHGSIDQVSAAYFRECEKRGVVLTERQKKWYSEKRRTATSAKSIKEEYPTFVEECWENQPEGSIYGRWIEQAKGEGRVNLWTPPKDYPVHTFWDIGMPINTATWLVQFTPYQVRVIDCLHEMDMTMEERAAWLRALGWDYGVHYFPWDADTDSASIGIIPINQYRRILGPSCRTLGRCKDVYDGIGIVRANFGRLVFCHNPATPADLTTPGGRMKRGMEYLARYREARESSTGITRNEPIHDRYSHIGSAFNQIGLAIVQGAVDYANHVGDARPKPERRVVACIHAGSRW